MARFRAQIMSLGCNFSTFLGSIVPNVGFIFRLREVPNDFHQLHQHLNLTEKGECPSLNSASKSLICSVWVMAISESGTKAGRIQWVYWAEMGYKLLHHKDLGWGQFYWKFHGSRLRKGVVIQKSIKVKGSLSSCRIAKITYLSGTSMRMMAHIYKTGKFKLFKTVTPGISSCS